MKVFHLAKQRKQCQGIFRMVGGDPVDGFEKGSELCLECGRV